MTSFGELPEESPDCDWPVVWGCGESCSHYESLDPAVQDAVLAMATDRLRAWTSYGPCPNTVRPCRAGCDSFHRGCGCYAHPCSCTRVSEVRLPGPIASIVEVMIDGVILDEEAYRVDNWKYLVRTDGQTWPKCQNLAEPPTEPDTWQIEYMRGFPVPAGGQLAAGLLACQFARAVCGDKCDLPMKASSVSRQGVSMTFDLQPGQTGIFLIDDWVMTANKGGARVLTPEKLHRMPRQETWSAV